MANITADIEQMLAELVQITAKIAATVNNTTRANAPGDYSDVLASGANRLALSAVIIAVVAFLIAALQAIFEYPHSSARHKCDSVAIGPFSKKVLTKWSFRHLRRKFYYPEIITYLNPDHYWVERPRPKRCTMGLFSGFRLGPSNPWPKSLHSGPRATWAQLLSPPRIDDIGHMTTRTYIDVDSIPGSLDVPPQPVDLVKLGTLLICIGFKSVKINVQERDFRAFASFGSVTTEEVPGFGKAVRFQNNGARWRPEIDTPREWTGAALELIRGRFDIHVYPLGKDSGRLRDAISTGYSDSVMWNRDSTSRANRMVLSLNKTIEEEGSQIRLDDIYEGVKAMSSASTQAAFNRWQSSSALVSNDTMCPNILVTLAVAGLPYANAGFPARLFLIPFFGQFRQIGHTVFNRCEKAPLELEERYHIDRLVQDLDPAGLIGLGEGIPYLTNLGLSHWAFEKTESLEESRWWRSVIREYFERMSGLEPTEEQEDGTFRQWRVVLPRVISLVKDFDPRSWMQPFSNEELRPRGSVSYALPLLKTQIILLDLSIQHLLHTAWKAYSPEIPFIGAAGSYHARLAAPDTFISHVMTAIFKAGTRRVEGNSEPFQNLNEVLLSQLITDDAINTASQEQINQIADFLKLRVVLYAAYLMIIPDSSDIVETSQSLGEDGFRLPMI
ncbi:hypothetical protein ANO14919_064480 [Xylariales sp. No.14919]|nr:hypothetical protein ANO14919_064480 [Xylariales sp. No.14919]